MIDRKQLLDDTRKLTATLVDDLRDRADQVDEVRQILTGEFSRAQAAGRTDRAYEDWREDLLAQVAVGWVLATVFVRFCEDNGLVDTPLLSGPGPRRDLARDHRTGWLGDNPALGDREWLTDVFDRYARIDATAELFGERNPLRLFGPSADGARTLLELWWTTDDDGQLLHDFTDPAWDTRFLGDLYQDLSEHAKKTYALLQTPKFIEEFLLDRTLDPAIETFGLDEVRMIDPTCGSGHLPLGGFHRLVELWQQREPSTPVRVLAQKALDAVAGVDVNPFAISIARFRLQLAAMKVSNIARLEDAPGFTINVAVGDSLLHGTRPGQMIGMLDEGDALLKHRYPTEDSQRAHELLTANRYHVCVGNPPYITVKDPALSTAYRNRYETCHRQYSLGVPFTERFFDLVVSPDEGGEAGYVGMITANSFTKAEFGKKLVDDFIVTRVDLTHIIDASGVYVPGHGTPTVVLFGRNQRPISKTVRVALGIRSEPGIPEDPSQGLVWSAIMHQLDKPGTEGEFISVEDAPRTRYSRHPWSLSGGAAPEVSEQLDRASTKHLGSLASVVGYTGQTNADEVFLAERTVHLRRGLPADWTRSVVGGADIRDWAISAGAWTVFPYEADGSLKSTQADDGALRALWRWRELLWSRRTFEKITYKEAGRVWWGWHQVSPERVRRPCIAFAFVATHNNFAFDGGGKVYNRPAPFIQFADDTEQETYLSIAALLNSSVACFWLKQVCKEKSGSGIGRGVQDEAWEERYGFDGVKVRELPLPPDYPTKHGCELAALSEELSESLPSTTPTSSTPTQDVLRDARQRVRRLRTRMVALQEELDWECYRLYGLVDEDLTVPTDELPELERGQRAFEIVLARKQSAGEVETSWFDRHGSTPITELPDHWPDAYRQVVERRIELITSERALGLLERPEYKRRWNWDDFDTLAQQALRSWLLDRLEAPELWEDVQMTTTARLADRLRSNEQFREVARLYAGQVDADIADVVEELALGEAVPYLAAYRLKPSGLRKRKVWEQVWELQRREDSIDARAELPADHPDHLDAEAAELAKKEQVGKIPVPPKYTSSDFHKTVYWRLRGKLDVPKERFVLLPDTRVGSDESSVIGWTGWDHLQQARALAGHYTSRKEDGSEPDELTPLLAGIDELVPWLKQWHNDVDPVYGERMGDFFDSFVDSEARTLGLTRDDLATWSSPTTSRKRRSRR